MKVLLVSPEFPDTFWSFRHALRFVNKKSAQPPMGLLTVAAMLPEAWEKRLVHMEVTPLKDEDLKWADLVLISATSVQKASAIEVISRCRKLGVRVVAGGPLFTSGHKEFDDVDHLVLNEAEATLPPFLEDLKNGCAKHVYASDGFPNMATSPTPLWQLVNMKKYASMSIQYSRGCPFNCDFCDVSMLFGRKVRTKSMDQILAELETLYSLGWRGRVFFVDDNFIGNRKKLKARILPGLIEWMERKEHPFTFNTESSIDLADDEELMRLMVRAGFNSVFVGIETPNENSLRECSKLQNVNRDLVASVNKIQRFGLEVQGGFIVGFDSDPPSIFERLSAFVHESGIVTAMVGLLNAPRGTRLYQRLAKEGRLLAEISGCNTDLSINFVPKMNTETLIQGYKSIISRIYSSEPYYTRVRRFLNDYKPARNKPPRFYWTHLGALFKSVFFLGIVEKERVHYWRLLFWTLWRRPRLFHMAITFTIYGFHYRRIFENCL